MDEISASSACWWSDEPLFLGVTLTGATFLTFRFVTVTLLFGAATFLFLGTTFFVVFFFATTVFFFAATVVFFFAAVVFFLGAAFVAVFFFVVVFVATGLATRVETENNRRWPSNKLLRDFDVVAEEPNAYLCPFLNAERARRLRTTVEIIICRG